jgi:hypothetical protein
LHTDLFLLYSSFLQDTALPSSTIALFLFRLSLLWTLLAPLVSLSQSVKGVVKDDNGQPIPYASVLAKGQSRGTSCNEEGYFDLQLLAGDYVLMVRSIGYQIKEVPVSVPQQLALLEIQLTPNSYSIREIVVKPGQEDPAYEIIRQAQKRRRQHLEEIEAYTSQVYVKGLQRLTQKPKRVMGFKVELDNVLDTTSGILYLSESLSELNYQAPDKFSETMIYSRVSGNNQAFSYNQASDFLFNFYQNNIDLPVSGDRKFISPIASNAMLNYRYKLLGVQYEGNRAINRIEVIPRFKSTATFQGELFIADDDYRIHSIDLYVTRDAQIEFVDTLRIRQIHQYINDQYWIPVQTSLNFSFSALGFKGDGYYLSVGSDFIINPVFSRKSFRGEILKIMPEANLVSDDNWEKLRPVPLTAEEKRDYQKKDSLFVWRNSKEYLDSIDRKNNRIGPFVLFTGYTYRNSYNKLRVKVGPLLEIKSFNTVQGWNFGTELLVEKSIGTQRIIKPHARVNYGINNRRWYYDGGMSYTYDKKTLSEVSFVAGDELQQFNPDNPIAPGINSPYTLFAVLNYMKLYERRYIEIQHSLEVLNGLVLGTNMEVSKRKVVDNSVSEDVFRRGRFYSSNNPFEGRADSTSSSFNSDAFIGTLSFVWKPFEKYIDHPRRKIRLGTNYPTLSGNFRYYSVTGSETVNHDFMAWTLQLSKRMETPRMGVFNWVVETGGFALGRPQFAADFKHFRGNQTFYSIFAENEFLLAPYYNYSTSGEYLSAHLRWNLGGMFLNRVPLLRKLWLNEIAGAGLLSTRDRGNFQEMFVGIERLNIQLAYAYSLSHKTQGIRAGIRF